MASRIPYLRLVLTEQLHERLRHAGISAGTDAGRLARGFLEGWLVRRVAASWGLGTAAVGGSEKAPLACQFRVPMTPGNIRAVKHAAIDAHVSVSVLVGQVITAALDKLDEADAEAKA